VCSLPHPVMGFCSGEGFPILEDMEKKEPICPILLVLVASFYFLIAL